MLFHWKRRSGCMLVGDIHLSIHLSVRSYVQRPSIHRLKKLGSSFSKRGHFTQFSNKDWKNKRSQSHFESKSVWQFLADKEQIFQSSDMYSPLLPQLCPAIYYKHASIHCRLEDVHPSIWSDHLSVGRNGIFTSF